MIPFGIMSHSVYSMKKKSGAPKRGNATEEDPCVEILELYKDLQIDTQQKIIDLRAKIHAEGNMEEKLKALERVVCLANLYRFFVDEVEMRNRESEKKNASGSKSNKD